MQYILTLITNPAVCQLDEQIINKAIITIERKGAHVGDVTFLSPNTALDVFFSDMEPAKAMELLTAKLDGIAVDFVVQPNNGKRRKRLLISDMDSTIINQECIDEIADKLGLKEKVSAITERAMNGELDFKDALLERVGLLAGLPEEALHDVYENHITLMSGAKELVATMKKHNALTILVSGGFTFFTSKVAVACGFDGQKANVLDIKNGKLTGKVIGPILNSAAKLEALQDAVKALKASSQDVIAVGDGANDLPMIKEAGMGVAYHAKPVVQEQVTARINHTDLKSLLYIQGYKEVEIVNG
jgi:phosphoserine phosphatase